MNVPPPLPWIAGPSTTRYRLMIWPYGHNLNGNRGPPRKVTPKSKQKVTPSKCQQLQFGSGWACSISIRQGRLAKTEEVEEKRLHGCSLCAWTGAVILESSNQARCWNRALGAFSIHARPRSHNLKFPSDPLKMGPPPQYFGSGTHL